MRKEDPYERELQALRKKGIQLPPNAMVKTDVLETDLANPKNLGLPDEGYQSLMLSLARHIAARRPQDFLVSFEFVSSIATVGHHPLWTGTPVVPDVRVPIESVLPTGYGEAKCICERMLDAMLHRYPERFRATAVRLDQIAGSAANGHCNPMEHISFMSKSSQTLRALPDLTGSLGWTAADDIAYALVEIMTQPEDMVLHPIYHIENSVRQAWSETITILADAMSTTSRDSVGVIPFEDWAGRLRDWPRREDNTAEGANPGYLLVDFLQKHFHPHELWRCPDGNGQG
ncbi:putative secondary metabolism biosynthetic enzyme [Cytospora paraplurivora]|uniref:Secondary metabolism biosynthetic enzyme n=1 Tax=Cytospora paraplurivora TaxID=2898453 RepID=A0AAN9ULV6_9PEZI